MAPTAAFDADGPVLAAGSAGGSRLRSAIVQTIAGILDEGLEPQAAVDRPRLHPAGRVVHVEPGFEEEALDGARATRASRCGAGTRGTTTSAASACVLDGGPPPIRDGVDRRSRCRPDRHPPEVAALGTAGVRAHRAVGLGLLVRAAAREALDADHGGDETSGRFSRFRRRAHCVCRIPYEPLCRCLRAARRAGRLDVAGDLLHELGLALERALVAQPLPELDAQRAAVEVAVEVEEERLDPPLDAAVVRVDADRERGAVLVGSSVSSSAPRRRRCRTRARGSSGVDGQVRGRESRACRRAGRPGRRALRAPAGGRAAPRRRRRRPRASSSRMRLDETPSTSGTGSDLEPEPPRAAPRSPRRPAPKRKPSPARTAFAPSGRSTESTNSSGVFVASSGVKSTTSRSSGSSSLEQLDAALDGVSRRTS